MSSLVILVASVFEISSGKAFKHRWKPYLRSCRRRW